MRAKDRHARLWLRECGAYQSGRHRWRTGSDQLPPPPPWQAGRRAEHRRSAREAPQKGREGGQIEGEADAAT